MGVRPASAEARTYNQLIKFGEFRYGGGCREGLRPVEGAEGVNTDGGLTREELEKARTLSAKKGMRAGRVRCRLDR